MKRLRGLKALVFDAVDGTTRLVERTHASVAERSVRRFAPIEPLATPAATINAIQGGVAAGVYASIRLVNRLVERVTDGGFEIAEAAGAEAPALSTPQRSDAAGSLSWLVDHAEGAINGFIGDRLSERENGLDLGMTVRYEGVELPLEPQAIRAAFAPLTRKLCVFVHGLSCTEWSWSLNAERYHGDPSENFGSLLRRDLGYTPVFIRYNSGRHVSENGRRLSQLLDELVAAYPGEIDEIVLVGHSMGGLVARSAAHYGSDGRAAWAQRLRHVFCIGSPHLGAPLEQATHLLSRVLRAFDTAGTQVPAEILEGRSAGIKDMRFGYTVDEEWQSERPEAVWHDNRHDLEFVDAVGYYFIAGTISRDPQHPIGHLFGDLLVRLPSASGHCREPARRLKFRSGKVFSGLHHFHLVNHPDVYQVIRRCIEEAPALPCLTEASPSERQTS